MKKWMIALLILIGILICSPYLIGIPPLKQIAIRWAEKSLDAKIKVKHLRLSWFGPQKFIGVQFATDDLTGTFEEVQANSPIWSINRNFTLSGGHIQVPENSSSIDNVQAVMLNSKIDASGVTHSGKESGDFLIQGTVVSLEEFQLTLDIVKMPTAIVDWFLKSEGKLKSLLGPSFDLQGDLSMQDKTGRCDFTLKSPTADISTAGSIKEGTLLLKKDLLATFRLTPAMSLVLSQNKIAVTGQDPIIMKINAKGFSLSSPFSLETLNIDNGSLSLGRFRLQNASYLSGLSIFLKTKKFNTDQVDAWLNRSDFSLNRGLLSLKRTDALVANAVHLCAWGELDLTQETLNMILGIPEDTLRKSFGIRSLASNYVLQIPLRGTFQKPDLDTNGATTKIGAIIAAGKLEGQGGIFKGVAGVFNQSAQEKSPPPNAPFPWEK